MQVVGVGVIKLNGYVVTVVVGVGSDQVKPLCSYCSGMCRWLV